MYLIKKTAEIRLTYEEIKKLYPNPGPPSGYMASTHLTSRGVGVAKNMLANIKNLPYGHLYYFTDTEKGNLYHFVAKVEPHSNSPKGVSVYELKPGSSPQKPQEELGSKTSTENKEIVSAPKNVYKEKSMTPQKGNFIENYGKLKGQAAENYVIDYVRNYVSDIPMKKLKIKDPNDSTKFIEVEVQPQYFSIEGYPVQVSAVGAQQIADILSAKSGKKISLPTKKVVDELYSGKAIALPFKWKFMPNQNDPTQFDDHSREVAKQLANIDPDKFVVGLMKEKTLPHENDNLHSQGLLSPVQQKITAPDGKQITVLELINRFHSLKKTDPDYNKYRDLVNQHGSKLKMIQKYRGSTGHDKQYRDYSEGTRFIGSVKLPDGREMGVQELLEKAKTDKSLQPYANILSGGVTYSNYVPKEVSKKTQESVKPSIKPKTKEQEINLKEKSDDSFSLKSVKKKFDEKIQQISKFLDSFKFSSHDRRRNIIKRASINPTININLSEARKKMENIWDLQNLEASNIKEAINLYAFDLGVQGKPLPKWLGILAQSEGLLESVINEHSLGLSKSKIFR